jgi:hypothetical protein
VNVSGSDGVTVHVDTSYAAVVFTNTDVGSETTCAPIPGVTFVAHDDDIHETLP